MIKFNSKWLDNYGAGEVAIFKSNLATQTKFQRMIHVMAKRKNMKVHCKNKYLISHDFSSVIPVVEVTIVAAKGYLANGEVMVEQDDDDDPTTEGE